MEQKLLSVYHAQLIVQFAAMQSDERARTHYLKCIRVRGDCNRIFLEISKKHRGLAYFPLLVKRLLSILFSKMNLCVLLKVRAHLYIRHEVLVPPLQKEGMSL